MQGHTITNKMPNDISDEAKGGTMLTDADLDWRNTYELYREHVNPKLVSLLRLGGLDVVEDHAAGCEIWDTEGKRYLDFLGLYGAMSVGHSHPRIVAAAKAQLERMSMPSKVMMTRGVALLAKRLCQLAPGQMRYAFFCNSGTEAVEGAIKIARAATKRTTLVSAFGGFHGKTLGALALTPKPLYQDPFRPLIDDVLHVPYGDVAAIERVVDESTAAVILEPIQGEGGINLPPPGYFREVRRITRERGALLIIDEVQTGLGRTGYWFGIEHEREEDGRVIEPDMITLAKALGGGIVPVGVFLAREELWAPFEEDPKIHSSTFGGNPLAMAVALETLEVINDGLLENTNARGTQLRIGLERIQNKFPYFISEVRGRGLMIGIDFTDADVGTLFVGEMSKRGVLTAFALNNQQLIRLEPPLTVSSAQVEEALQAIEESLVAVQEELQRYGLFEDVFTKHAEPQP